MRRIFFCSALVISSTSFVAVAHPIDLRFDSLGQCESAKAQVNNFDRKYVAGPVFGIENNGEAQVFFLESFRCEYDEIEGSWRMVNHMDDPSGIGSAFDH